MERLKILLRYVLATRICLDMNTLIQKKPYLCQMRQANTQTSLRTRVGSPEYSLLVCAKYGSILGRYVQNLISRQFARSKKVSTRLRQGTNGAWSGQTILLLYDR